MNIHKEYATEIGGKKLVAQFTDVADQASGSVLLRYGDTIVLATAVMGAEPRSGVGYFPLTVEYEERFYAAGQILGSRFMRREGKPSDEAVLSGRAVDRTLRPFFDHSIRNEVQVVITVLSVGEDDPDVLAINAASLAVATSDIPWNGPVAAVRMGKQNGDWHINPSYVFRNGDTRSTDLLVCGASGLVNMIELGAHEVPEDVLSEGVEKAITELKTLEDFQKSIVTEIGKEKRDVPLLRASDKAQQLFEKEIAARVDEFLFGSEHGGKLGIQKLDETWRALVAEHLPDEPTDAAVALLDRAIDEAVHRGAFERNMRVDGRPFDEVRQLSAQAGGLSPVLHGSGTFYRGGTHILSVLTLGGPKDSLLIDTMETQDHQKQFMHHYNFPPFSVGETGRIGGFNRRMIGHGALAEKALKPVIPKMEDFPYTIRVVSEALASNGSTSMGSVCGGTLALMDAGVPITRPVAGIAMGLMLDQRPTTNDRQPAYKILTDIQGPEDHHGDMDLKIAGTREGVTAIQMDVKVSGVTAEILKETFVAARAARHKILDVIEKEIPSPRTDLSPTAPRVVRMAVPADKLGLIIGSGGKTIKALQEKTSTQIDLEDDGTVYITGMRGGVEEAQKTIADMVRDPEAGERYDNAEVTRITDFGAFVRISKNHEGLVHISELAPFRIRAVSDVVSIGDTVPVIIKEVDQLGRLNLSIKDADPEFATKKGVAPSTHEPSSQEHDRGNTRQHRSTKTNRRNAV